MAVSGTIKKLQAAAIVQHRRVTAAAVAGLLLEGEYMEDRKWRGEREWELTLAGAKGEAEQERLRPKWEQEREALGRLED